MRKLHLTTGLTVALVVAGGAIAAGQVPGSTALTRPGSTTITVTDMSPIQPGVLRGDESRQLYHEEGRTQTMTWVASDPRLSGPVTSITDRTMLRDGSTVESGTLELANDEGRWVGVTFGVTIPAGDTGPIVGLPVPMPDPQPQGSIETVHLEGEGAYEDMEVIASIDWRQDPPVIDAVIFSGGPVSGSQLEIAG